MSKKIYINPGHSDLDPGAVGFETERTLNVKTANYMNAYLLANYLCQTRMTPGTNNSPYAAVQEANDWGADLFVSIHNNAGGGDGYEALVSSEKQIPLGSVFEKYVIAAGQNSRGVKLRPGLTVLCRTKMPAVLNEGAFVDNATDIRDWNEDAELEKLGIAYANAAAEFLKLEKKNPAVCVTLPVLSYGSKGEAVRAVQILLKGRGYNVGATGSFGSGTKAAVEKAQGAYHLPVTGKADAETWTALLGVE